MGSEFDYSAPDAPATAVADVVSEIKNQGKLPPLTDEQIAQRKVDAEIYQAECQWRDQERRAESDRKQAVAAAMAEHERRVALEQAQRKARRERQEQISREVRERELRDLRQQVTRQDWWQRNVDAAARNAVAVRERQALISDLDRIVNPPAPPPEPEVIYAEPEEETFCGAKIPRWR